jgi:hypothetical protein
MAGAITNRGAPLSGAGRRGIAARPKLAAAGVVSIHLPFPPAIWATAAGSPSSQSLTRGGSGHAAG